jgi:hypothetical protein
MIADIDTPEKLHATAKAVHSTAVPRYSPYAYNPRTPAALGPILSNTAASPEIPQPVTSVAGSASDDFGPVVPQSLNRGRKERRWYVIIRGHETGVFFDYW